MSISPGPERFIFIHVYAYVFLCVCKCPQRLEEGSLGLGLWGIQWGFWELNSGPLESSSPFNPYLSSPSSFPLLMLLLEGLSCAQQGRHDHLCLKRSKMLSRISMLKQGLNLAWPETTALHTITQHLISAENNVSILLGTGCWGQVCIPTSPPQLKAGELGV